MASFRYAFTKKSKVRAFWFVCLAILSLGLFYNHGHAGEVLQYGGSCPTWPTTEWISIPSLNDPIDSVTTQLDFVGDSTNPGCYHYYNKTSGYMFFRVRVNYSDSVTYGRGNPFLDSIFVMIDCGSSTCAGAPDGTEDYAFAWDTQSNDWSKHGLEMVIKNTTGATWNATRFDDIDGLNADKTAPPDFGVSNGDGCVRTIDQQSTTNFGTAPNHYTTFIDFSVKCSYLAANTNLRCTGQTWKIQLGSIAVRNDHNLITEDVAGNSAPTAKVWSSSTNASIDLLSFNAQRGPKGIRVSWATGSEFGCGSFKLMRSRIGEKMGESLDRIELPLDAIPCKGDAVGSIYEIEDHSTQEGASYSYMLSQRDASGGKRDFGPLILKTGETRSSFAP